MCTLTPDFTPLGPAVARRRSQHRLPYPLVLLSPVAFNTLKFAQSQLEWLNDGLSHMFERTRENPFACRRALRV